VGSNASLAPSQIGTEQKGRISRPEEDAAGRRKKRLKTELGRRRRSKKTEILTGGPAGFLKRRCQMGLIE
jgi:hypothetical protein